MTSRLSDYLRYTAVSVMLAAGLLMPALAMAGILASAWTAALICVMVTAAVFNALLQCQQRKVLYTCITAAAMMIGWLLLPGRIDTVRDGFAAFSLARHGVTFLLLPWVNNVILPLSWLIAFLSCLSVHSKSGPAFSLFGVMLMVLMLWLTKCEQALWLLLPACAAALAQWSQERNAEAFTWRSLTAMLCIAAAAILIVPTGQTLDPLRDAADRLRQTILDRYFYTEPRDLFSLAREGYYPNGQEQLGGKPSISDRPVMTVETPGKVYLRGAILDTYTGRTWQDSTGSSRYLWDSPRWQAQRAEWFDERLPASGDPSVQQVTVTMTADHVSTVCVPQRIRSIETEGGLVIYFNEASELFTTRNLRQGDRYRLSAVLATADDPGMASVIAACADESDQTLMDRTNSVYTSLPGHLYEQQELVWIAAEAAGDSNDRFAQVTSIKEWLGRNCRYSLDVEDPNPNQDFVAAFLVRTREGYCTYFASAMVVLCRMNGIPARYVEGYTASPAEDGIAEVTGRNGHAWAEVWFPGYGWLTVDPTPGENPDHGSADPRRDNPPPASPTPTPTPPDEHESTPPPSDSPEENQTPTPPPADQQEDRLPDEEQTPKENELSSPETDGNASLWWLLLLIILLLMTAGAVCRIRSRQPERLAKRAGTEYERWVIWMQALCDALHIMGEVRAPDATLAQWLSTVDEKRSAGGRLHAIGETAGMIFYGHAEPLPEETEAAAQAYQRVNDAMTKKQRCLLALRRAFGRSASFMKTEGKRTPAP